MKAYARRQSRPQQVPTHITEPSAKSLAESPTVNSILYLQRTIGNQAVQRLLRANAEAPCVYSDTPATTCPTYDSSRTQVQSESPVKLQAKLTVSTPGDAYEREADRVSEQVAKTAEPGPRCACGGGCVKCGNEGTDHDLLRIERAQANDAGGMVAPPVVHEVLRSAGQPLDGSTRALMESRFGHDFSRVRVHTDARAAESARAVNALAYTVGRDVVFGEGQFTPGTGEGRKLLAHELAHVVQQGDGETDRLSRVPTESGVRNDRYSYSTNCGWIDWSHADPVLTNNLITRVRQASDALRAAGTSATPATGQLDSPTMTSTVPHAGIVLSGASLTVRLVRPLSADEVLSVALSMYKTLSVAFETQQAWTDIVGESSFSQEDLPSNLISFYMAARGYTRDQVNEFCGTVSREDALREYGRDHDFDRNRTFAPVGATGQWPAALSNVDDSQAAALYEVLTISTTQGASVQNYCPIYRIEGRVNETDLLIFSLGGATFTAADNVRVVPTYRFQERTTGRYGHVRFIEVEPYSQPDFLAFRQRGLSWPIYLPSPALVCLSSHSNPIR